MTSPQESDAQFVRARLAHGCGTMKQLLLGLLDAKGRAAEDVHGIRKLGKSLRGGFALFHLEKSSALKIQAIGRLLSGSRDAVSRLNTWHQLAWSGDPRVAAAIAGLLDQQTHPAAHRPPAKTIAWCTQHLDEARRELLAVPSENLADLIAMGLNTLEKRACKRCHHLDHGSAKNFHQARKALKAWLGAIDFLPAGLVTPDPKFSQLAELLGDENDLATLSSWLKTHGFTPEFAPDLWQTLKASRRKLQQEAIDDARDLPDSSHD